MLFRSLVVDLGIYCHRHPRVSANYFRSLRVSEDVIAYIDDIYERGSDSRQAFPRDPSSPDADRYLFPDDLTRLFKHPLDEFYAMMSSGYENTPLETLDEYLPWIKSFHAKF